MLINLRNALMAGKRLPYDAEVEYLESTGTQWIDTGVLANGEFDFDYMFRMNTLQGNTVGMGARSSSQFLTALQINNTQRFAFAYLGTVWSNDAWNISAGRDYRVQLHFHNGSQSIAVDGNTLLTDSSVGVEALNLPIYIFKRSNSATETVYGLNGRFYFCKIYQNGTLVRDYITVRKGTVGYLYDRVSGKLFGNAGTGDFVLGADVVPVEYLQSSGTQWIDTGVVPTADDSFYCRVKQSAVRDQCLWGLAGVAYCFSNLTGVGVNNGTFWGHPAIGTGGVNGVNPLGDTNWHEILCQPSGVFVDGVQINTQVSGSAQSPQNTVALFARAVNSAGGGIAKNGQGRMSAFKVERNGDPLRKYYPVRVGTDATSWEGAMMDVLTRRIYRNAGTGAFTYGNDLKYPIPSE